MPTELHVVIKQEAIIKEEKTDVVHESDASVLKGICTTATKEHKKKQVTLTLKNLVVIKIPQNKYKHQK